MLMRLTLLSIFRAEMDHLLTDSTFAMLKRIKLAFLHLQRLIIVDERASQQWIEAFAQNEPRCEKLGAVHLLSHGIWAFKVDSTGERTDLVLQTPLRAYDEIISAADVLALTEWKLIRDKANYQKQLNKPAIRQNCILRVPLVEWSYTIIAMS